MTWLLLALLAVVVGVPLVKERSRRVMNETARGSAPGQFAVLPRGVTHFTWHGPREGPVAVCVHGLTTPSFVWQGITLGLVRMGFRVLTYDLYGRGFSDRPRGRQNRAFFVQQLEDLLAHERVERDVTVIGYSMGGAIAACFAADHMDRVRQMVLLAPAGIEVNRGLFGGVVRHIPVVGDWLMLAFYPASLRRGIKAERDMPTSVPDIGRLRAGELAYKRFVAGVLSSIRGVLAEGRETEHRAIREAGLPVVAIWGREDGVIPIRARDTLAEWNPDARQEVIEGAGHALTYSHTEEVLAVLRDALTVRPSPALRVVFPESEDERSR